MNLKAYRFLQPLFLLSIFVAVFAFQNCSRSQIESVLGPNINSSVGSGGSLVQGEVKVIGLTAGLSYLRFDPSLTMVALEPSQLSAVNILEVDLLSGRYTLKAKIGGLEVGPCALATEDEQNLQALMSVSRICQPGGAASSTQVHCQAIPIEDILLSSDNRQVGLSAVLCGTGTYLCDGQDQKLRDILAQLLKSGLNNCQLN